MNPIGQIQSMLDHSVVPQIELGENDAYEQERNHFIREILEGNFLREILNRNDLQDLIITTRGEWFLIGRDRELIAPAINQHQLDLFFRYQNLKNGSPLNVSNPFSSFTTIICDKTVRLSTSYPGVSASGQYACTLRIQRHTAFEANDFGEESGLLIDLFKGKKNIVICGATGSGKTTCLNALLRTLDSHEHIIAIEDVEELYIERGTHFVSSPKKGHGLDDFTKYALRLRPDRLLLGEIRSAEVIPFLMAANTGHKGLACTLHANSAIEAFDRLALLFQLYAPQSLLGEKAIRSLLANAIDSVVFIEGKKIRQIIKTLGSNEHQIFHEVIA